MNQARSIGVYGLTFCAINARNILKDDFNWTFVGDMPGMSSAASFTSSSGDWYGDVNHWSTMEFPTFCTDVTIPNSKSVSVSTGIVGTANTLAVELGGVLDVSLGAELIIQHLLQYFNNFSVKADN